MFLIYIEFFKSLVILYIKYIFIFFKICLIFIILKNSINDSLRIIVFLVMIFIVIR